MVWEAFSVPFHFLKLYEIFRFPFLAIAISKQIRYNNCIKSD